MSVDEFIAMIVRSYGPRQAGPWLSILMPGRCILCLKGPVC